MAPRFGRAPFTRAGAILSCICFTAILAAPAIAQASPIAIISKQHDGSDAFTEVVGALCEKKGKDDEREDEQSFCRHFEDDREVSSLLMQNAEAFAAIVTEVRAWFERVDMIGLCCMRKRLHPKKGKTWSSR